jgi:G6PDH family F420-dependent oxidoreductase
MRIHPAIIAQAAATAAVMMPDRFFLGVGTGENLNEHIFGDHWPPAEVRLDMLEEAMKIIRLLWEGDTLSYWGDYYTVENARVYTLPSTKPSIMMAAGGTASAELAGTAGDGLISTAPDAELVEKFESRGGAGRPCYGQLTVCWAETEPEARLIAYEWWPNTAITGELKVELATPAHFEQAAAMVREDDVAKEIVCGPDPERHIEEITKFIDAGYDHVYIHQVGPDQEGFFRFYEQEILPQLR